MSLIYRGALGRQKKIHKNKWGRFNLCLNTIEIDKRKLFVIYAIYRPLTSLQLKQLFVPVQSD